MTIVISPEVVSTIGKLVAHYQVNIGKYQALLEGLIAQLTHDTELKGLTHSLRHRLKDPEHLRDKLMRKAGEAAEKDEPFIYTRENLFQKINDLAGCRLLHLYSRQFDQINKALTRLFREANYKVIEKADARTWDDEYRDYYKSIKVRSTKSKKMYTSVHYVVSPNARSGLTCEIQVRTLAEELWGEVDHAINYPHPSPNDLCVEQIKVLARLTSSCTRLVDSVFRTHNASAALNPSTAVHAEGTPLNKSENFGGHKPDAKGIAGRATSTAKPRKTVAEGEWKPTVTSEAPRAVIRPKTKETVKPKVRHIQKSKHRVPK